MLSIVLVLSLSAGDSLSGVTLQKLNFKAPSSWQKAQPDPNSLEWDAGSDKGKFAVSVYVVDPQRPAKACLDQMVEAVGKEGFVATTVATQPASKKVSTDYIGDENAAKTDDNKVTTTTVLGCNGKIRWVLTWSSKTSEGSRFGPMLKRVLESINYGR